MAIWGVECGLVLTNKDNEIEKVYARNGKESKLYTDIKEQLKSLPKEALQKLKDTYKSWEDGIIHSSERLEDIALAIYAKTQTTSFKENNKDITLDENKEPTIDVIEDFKTPVNSDNVFYQTDDAELEGSKMSDVTVSEMREHYKRMNVDYDNTLDGIVDEEGNKLSTNETVDVHKKIVKVIKDKENVAIGEAGMHIVTRIIKQTNPKLYQEMMNKINKYNLYDAVVERYKKLKNYQLEDGKPNIPKIKEETIGKVLNEYFIKFKEGDTEKPQLLEQTQSWWDRIVEKLKSFFVDNPFERAAKKFDEGEYDTVETTDEGDNEFNQLADKSKGDKIFDNITATLAKVQHIKTTNENYYNNLTTGQKILKRVTDRVKKRLEKKFSNKKVSEKETEEWLQKSETGVKGHADVDDINNRYIDKTTGLARRNEQGELTPLAKTNVSQINSNDARYYEMLEKEMVNLINQYSSDTKFIWENPIYDQKFDEVGTPDFMAIHKNGVVDIYDWKFLDIKDNVTDLAAYKKEIFNIQLDAYVDILKSDYGVEKIGKSRIIPIKAIYTRTNGVLEFKGIEVANSANNYKNETREYLLPFPTNAEVHRENPQIQSKIEQLNKLAKELSNTKGSTEDAKLTIKHRMLELKKAIRHIQVKEEVTTGVEVANAYLNNVGKNFKEYVTNFKNETANYTNKDLERISRELNDAKEFLSPFNNLEHLFKDSESKKELQDLSYRIQEAMSYMNELGSLLIEKGIANPRNMFGVAGESSSGFKYADEIRTWGQNLFDYSSNASTKMAQLFHRVRDEAYQKTEFEMDERLREYSKVAEPVQEWIKKNSSEKLQDALLKKGDKWGLINKYSDEFTTALSKAIEEGNTAWIKDNIRVEQYMEKYKQNFEKYSKWAEDTFKDYTSNKDKNKQLIYDKKLEFEQKYDIKNFPKTALSHSNDLLRRFPSDDPHIGWLSKEYKYLLQKENKPLLDVYNYMQDLVKEAQDLGILDSYDYNFFPQIYKTMTESLEGSSKFKSVITNLGNSVTLKPGDRGYINEITKEPERNILVNFIRDLGKTTASGAVDYSHVSKDVLSAIALFEKEIVKYKYAEEIEPIVKLLINVEREKDVLVTDTWNRVVIKDGKPVTQKNNKNADYLETMVDFGLYGIRGAEIKKD